MVTIKGKILFLVSVLVITSITVAAYPVISTNSQLEQSNQVNTVNDHKVSSQNKISHRSQRPSNYSANRGSTNRQYTASQVNVKPSKSQSIARKYIEEPCAVAGKPEMYKIGGKDTDVVPVLLNGKRVGEINIDPKTGKNVGGAGGAP